MTELLVATALLVALIGFSAWRTGRHTRRRAKVLAFAAQRGWAYRSFDSRLVDRWIGVPFGRGEKREVSAVVRGEINGSAFTAFEYTYVVPRERVSRAAGLTTSATADVVAWFVANERKRFSVVVVDLPTYLPGLTVEPESLLDRATIASGAAQDIELESEDFNRRYRVTARDPRNASDVLTPRTMELLLSRPPLAFRSEGAHLISWKPGGMDAMDVLRRASTLDEVADGVPGFVWTDNGADRPKPATRLDSGSGAQEPRHVPWSSESS